MLWGGGIYNWFDPLTLIRAVDAFDAPFPHPARCSWDFSHPNPEIPEMRMAVEARAPR